MELSNIEEFGLAKLFSCSKQWWYTTPVPSASWVIHISILYAATVMQENVAAIFLAWFKQNYECFVEFKFRAVFFIIYVETEKFFCRLHGSSAYRPYLNCWKSTTNQINSTTTTDASRRETAEEECVVIIFEWLIL